MKFRFLSFYFFFFLSVFGQDEFQKSKYFGFEFGPNFTTFFYNSTQNNGETSVYGKYGLLAGISNELIVKPKISIKYGFFYQRKGAVLTTSTPIFKTSLNFVDSVKLDYFVIPLLFSYNNLAGMYCNVGPYIGLLPQSVTYFKRFDFGSVFGIGIRFKLSKNKLFDVGIKENLGLFNISTIGSTSYRNNSISLSFSLKFKFE